VPQLKDQPLKLSSVIVSGRLQPAKKKKYDDPLVRDGSKIVPSVTHVFSATQHLYLYNEVYDPQLVNKANRQAATEIRPLTNVLFFQGSAKAFELP